MTLDGYLVQVHRKGDPVNDFDIVNLKTPFFDAEAAAKSASIWGSQPHIDKAIVLRIEQEILS